MKRIEKKATPNYDVFLGLVEKFKDNWALDTTFAQNLTGAEIALLNGYKANTGDSEVGIYQTLGLRSVQFDSRQATYRLAMYCMALDGEIA